MKNTSYKLGDAVVFKCDNGDSVSATVTHVFKDMLYVAWYPAYAQQHSAAVMRKDWAARLTPFGSAMFLAL